MDLYDNPFADDGGAGSGRGSAGYGTSGATSPYSHVASPVIVPAHDEYSPFGDTAEGTATAAAAAPATATYAEVTATNYAEAQPPVMATTASSDYDGVTTAPPEAAAQPPAYDVLVEVLPEPIAPAAAPASGAAAKSRRRGRRAEDNDVDVDAMFDTPVREKGQSIRAAVVSAAVDTGDADADNAAGLVDVYQAPLTTATSASRPAAKALDAIAAAPRSPKASASEPRYRQVTVSDPEKVAEGITGYIIYKVSAESAFIDRTYVCRRRYSDFEWLFAELVTRYPGVIIPALPEKKAVGRFEPDFVEAR